MLDQRLSLLPTVIVTAKDKPYSEQLRDFVDSRLLSEHIGFVLLWWFHLCYSCRLVARRCHECIQTRETYGLLTKVYLFFGV
jgi:hypothetical protein